MAERTVHVAANAAGSPSQVQRWGGLAGAAGQGEPERTSPAMPLDWTVARCHARGAQKARCCPLWSSCYLAVPRAREGMTR